jgi:hypothetical protein
MKEDTASEIEEKPERLLTRGSINNQHVKIQKYKDGNGIQSIINL